MLISSPGEVYRKLLFFTIALLFGVLELWIPRIPLFPWLKPGLANVVTMIWLIRYGFRDTILFGLLRIWISAFLFGFSFFTIIPAVSGLLFSVIGMKLILTINRSIPLFGFFGLGIGGAFLHNTGQLFSLKFLVGEASLLAIQFPVMTIAAIGTGAITAVLAWKFDQLELGDGGILADEIPIHSISFSKKIFSLILLMIMIAVLWLQHAFQTLVFAVSIMIVVLILTKSLRQCIAPFRRSWVFLLTLFLAARLGNGEWEPAFLQLFRLSGWILCTEIFRKLETDRLFFHGLNRLFPRYESTLASALLAVELFPEVFKNSVIKTALRPVLFFRSPSEYLHRLIEMSHQIIEESGWGKRHS